MYYLVSKMTGYLPKYGLVVESSISGGLFGSGLQPFKNSVCTATGTNPNK